MGAPKKPTAEVKSGKLAAALRHAGRGWSVFPVHGIRHGKCTCGTDCKSPGKHPCTANGLKDGTTDVDTINRWWNKWPDANIGIATGSVSGILVLDVDPRNGGDETLKRLRRGKDLPTTPTCLTGGGGSHRYFGLSPGVRFRSRNSFLPGLDIKADGGYVIAPLSVHKSGQTYKWVSGLSPSKAKLAPMPSWLAKQLSENRRRKSASTGDAGKPILEGQRNNTLVQMAGRLRRAGVTLEEIGATLSSINQRRCDPPLSEREIQAIANSAAKWGPGTGSSPYSATEEGIFWERVIGDDVVPVRLVNFDARIVTDISEDDGVEVRRTYEIQTDLLGRRKTFPVPAAQFPTMNWATENLGARAIGVNPSVETVWNWHTCSLMVFPSQTSSSLSG